MSMGFIRALVILLCAGLVAACNSGNPDAVSGSAPTASPTATAAGMRVYDGPAAPDLVVREVPLAAGVGRGLDHLGGVKRVGEVAVLTGRSGMNDVIRSVDIRTGNYWGFGK